MIDREGLRLLLATVSGVPTSYRDEPRDMVDPTVGAQMLVELRNPRRLGEGSDEHVEDEADPNVPTTTSTHLEVIAVLLLESFDHDLHAQDRLFLVRSRLAREHWIQALDALDLAVVRASEIQTLGTAYDKRIRSCAALDLTLRSVLHETQTAHDAAVGAPTYPGSIQAAEINGSTIGEPHEEAP